MHRHEPSAWRTYVLRPAPSARARLVGTPALEQAGRGHVEGTGQGQDGVESDAALTALDGPDMVAVQVSLLRKPLLGQASGQAQVPKASTERPTIRSLGSGRGTLAADDGRCSTRR